VADAVRHFRRRPEERPKLLKEIDRALARRKGDIGKLLGDYRMPLVESAEAE
jgi:hypothetical protein